MKANYTIQYSYGTTWHEFMEIDDMFYAKQQAKKMKDHVGKEGKVRILNSDGKVVKRL